LRDSAIPAPGRPQNKAEPIIHRLDHGPYPDAAHRAADVVARLDTPHPVGIERDGHHDSVAAAASHGRLELHRLHQASLAGTGNASPAHPSLPSGSEKGQTAPNADRTTEVP